MDQSFQLSQVLDTFLYLCKKGKSWVIRNDCHTFDVGVVYHAVVERIQSEKEATLVIGKRSNGFPLVRNEQWNERNNEFGRVLITVDRLHPEENQLPYGEMTRLYDVLNEGDNLEVKIEKSAGGSPNLFFYFAAAGWKVKPTECMQNNIVNVIDPLRGCVEKIDENEQMGVMNFGTYDGSVARAIFFSGNLYVKGEKCNTCVSLNSLTPIGTELFLEVTCWTSNGIIQEWEKDVIKAGIKFIATRVWLKGDPQPIRSVGEYDTTDTAETNSTGRENVSGCEESNKTNNFSVAKDSSEMSTIFKGVLESFIGLRSAIVCVAHRDGAPLSFTDNWCAEDVRLERVLLKSCNLKSSELGASYTQCTRIAKVIKIGDYLKLALEPCEKAPEQCYKWCAKTCWKIDGPEVELSTVSIHSLSKHLCGTIESSIKDIGGIINFITYFGLPAKAYFKCQDICKCNKSSLCSSQVSGTKVNLVVRRRSHCNTERDQNLLKNGVLFTAVKVWCGEDLQPSEQTVKIIGHVHEPSSFGDLRKDLNSMSKRVVNDEFNLTNSKKRCGERASYQRLPKSETKNLIREFGDNGNIANDSESSTLDLFYLSDNINDMSNALNESLGDSNERNVSNSPSKLYQKYKGKSDFCRDVNGTLIALEDSWGLVGIEDKALVFQSSNAYLFGLQLQGVSLHKIFHCDQAVKVCICSAEVLRLDYGSLQTSDGMRKSILIYCEKKLIADAVKEKLVQLMNRQNM